ncbi:hypothetical protein AQ610_13880 [Burkholderia humptydooensis]|uniref:Uncharacterized protein n=1 Tax=Burkholderia humptydooensis MSMB43 TaxID=441157 RepID=A0ABN0GDV0_9BURK|nr:hypothetical protein AQ610_13880 [Burkholderia humptydooensis]EIP90341.1 hypothetical protein A33K_13931 [Burkholderia humptydooensis MSMB43]
MGITVRGIRIRDPLGACTFGRARSTVRPWRHAPDGVPGGSRFATYRSRLRAHRKLAGLRHRSRSPGSHR